MRIDETTQVTAMETLDDVRTALNDRLKGIRMEYLPQTFWSQRDKANARAMIQAIDKRLKTRRIMRSLERFVGGRPYGEKEFNTSAGKSRQEESFKLKSSDHRFFKMVTKRVWKATGKLIADIGYQWRPTGKKFALGKLNCGYQWRPTGKKFALGELCPLTKLSVKCRTGRPLVSDSGCLKLMTGNRSNPERCGKPSSDSRFGMISL
ncbi:hypothetical protein Tco_0884057 [Tanacetum coccineum]